jgi:hypothetical protein
VDVKGNKSCVENLIGGATTLAPFIFVGSLEIVAQHDDKVINSNKNDEVIKHNLEFIYLYQLADFIWGIL